MKEKSKWIWNEHWSNEDKDRALVMLFRKEIDLKGAVKSFVINISADTKYKLYINGHFVEYGPSRGDKQIWFYDTFDISEYMNLGINALAVAVLRYPEDPSKGNHGMIRTPIPGLFIEGEIEYEGGNVQKLYTDETWKCRKDDRISFVREEERFAPLIIHEKVYGDLTYRAWKMPGYDDSFWDRAFAYDKASVPEAVSPGNLYKRTIPLLFKKNRLFKDVINLRMSCHGTDDWRGLLKYGKEIVIPPNTKELIEIDAGEEMTGFLHMAFAKGMGTEVRILYSEAYVQDGFIGPERIPVKADRTDVKNGHLVGYSDIYYLYGLGDEIRAENYHPFWFRTFRFVQLTIQTKNEPLVIKAVDYKETGYPLDVRTSVGTSDDSMGKIWEISERTLRRCMHETYEDCPFYEQLQYIMDTRQQILYTYAVSADDRLARKCIEDMRRAQRYDGLLNCSYPNCNTNVIPGFSIYYILMVYDHMMYFGDRKFVAKCMPVIEQILNFFHENLTEKNLVGSIGGRLDKARFWSFIDWATEWNDTNGVPPAYREGPLTMESLLYIYGLIHAAHLLRYLRRNDQADLYEAEAELVRKAILSECRGKNGMLTDGPGVEQYSQHCQVFAVLTGTGEPGEMQENLRRTATDRSFTQCSVAMRFYLFRALELTDMYELTRDYWEPWRKMLDNHCTTCVESEAYARSECHGWGALALYELPSVTLGVRPAAPGFSKILVKPVPGYMTNAQGVVITPKGEVSVSWKMNNGQMEIEYNAPDGVEVITV